MGCPNDEAIFDFVRGALSEERTRAIDEHLATCEECRAVVVEAVRGLTTGRSGTPVSRPGSTAARRRRRWPAVAAAVVMAVGAGALWVITRRAARAPSSACAGGDKAFVWSGNGHCYTRHDRARPWAEARGECHRRGGELLSYTSYGEALPVSTALFPDAQTQRWIGYHADGRGGFGWVTGEPLPPPGAPWAPGQPAAGECVFDGAALANGVPQWSAEACTKPLPYVCESAPWTVRPTTGHAYKLFYKPASWDQARAACAAEGAHLVTLSDLEEQSFVAAQLHVTVWIGATDRAREQSFVWDTGERFAFTSFAPMEPDDPTGLCDCLAMGSEKMWHDRPCDLSYSYVCERD